MRYLNLTTGRQTTKVPEGFVVDEELQVIGTADQIQHYRNSLGADELSLPTGTMLPCRLIRVIDGDTMDLSVKLSVRALLPNTCCMARCLTAHIKIRCRLEGIDTAEKNTDVGKKTKEFVQEFLHNKRLRCCISKHEKYGRSLGTLFIRSGVLCFGKDSSVNQYLLDNRMAVAYDGGSKEKAWSQV
jgi:endonuclease YncB( thermonuclease family)